MTAVICSRNDKVLLQRFGGIANTSVYGTSIPSLLYLVSLMTTASVGRFGYVMDGQEAVDRKMAIASLCVYPIGMYVHI